MPATAARSAAPRPTAPSASPRRSPSTPVDPMTALWNAYFATRGKPAFDALVAAYRPYVETVATRFAKRLPPSVDIDDLVSAGCFGLMDAVAGFDAERGVKFQTFALKRIVGAMNDYLRSQDIAPRLARRREAIVKRARDDFRKANGRSPTEDELLRLIHTDVEEARAIVAGAQIPGVSSLSGPSDDDGHRGGPGGGVSANLDQAAMVAYASDGPQRGLPGGLFDRDIQKWLGRALSRSEGLIIWLYYFESLTMKEIGLTLGICEGRVSQIHALLLERLRARLTRDREAV